MIQLVVFADDSRTPFWIAASVSDPMLRVGSPIRSVRGMGSEFRDVMFAVTPNAPESLQIPSIASWYVDSLHVPSFANGIPVLGSTMRSV